MLSHALVFMSAGIIAGLPSLMGITGVSTQISWMLLVIGILLLVIHLAWGDRHRLSDSSPESQDVGGLDMSFSKRAGDNSPRENRSS
jgi:uncharacterized membrane protein YtjA (UPF0391 family)